MSRPRASFAIYFLFCFAVISFSLRANSQTLPSFKITLSNNKILHATDLPKGKAIVLIYFDPDCDHCQKLMAEFFKNINSFKKAQIVLVTFKPVIEIIAFEKKYDTRKYPNIKVGTEGTLFYLKNYYKLVKMPFTALYDSKGNYSYSYREETPVDDLISRLKRL
jgi:hypothetical protein